MREMKDYSLEEILFALLRSEVCGTEPSSNIKNQITSEKLPAVYKLSKLHDLAHLTGNALEKHGLIGEDSPMYEPFFKARNMAIYRYETSNYELGEICRILEQEQIKHMPLKGAIIRNYYPEPWMRTSCDLDILVDSTQVKRIVKLLTKKYDYKYYIHTQHDYSLFSASGVHIELHTDLIFYKKSGADFVKRVWETAVLEKGTQYRFKMRDDLFFAYHVAHMAQHVVTGGGCGVKPFIDLWIIQNIMKIDVTPAMEILREQNLTKFTEKSIDLSAYWFADGEKNEKIESFAHFILVGGVYGSTQNKVKVGRSIKKGKIRYILGRLFVPYRNLVMLYPSLKKCPILFPFYQVRRWFRLVLPNGVGVKNAVNELKATTNESEGAEKLLNDLGLQE